MKIVRVVSELDFGGVEQVLAVSIPELVKNRHQIKIIVLGRGGKVSDQLIEQGVEVEILNHDCKIPNFKLLLRVIKLLRKEVPDVIHCQGAEANFHGLWAAKLAGIPLRLGEEIGLPNHHSYWKWIFKWTYRNAHYVITISEAVKEKIVEFKEVERQKVKVLYNPIADNILETNDYSLIDFDKTSFIFITTCRLVPIKNLDNLIKAFARVKEKSSKKQLALWIVGEGPERLNLEKLSCNLNIQNEVKFLGYKSNVTHYLKNADIFVLPSLSEGSSISLVEAMAANLPSIVTANGGAGEILGDSQSGILIDPRNQKTLVDAMYQVIQLPKIELKEMGIRAQKETERFIIGNYIPALEAIYSNQIVP